MRLKELFLVRHFLDNCRLCSMLNQELADRETPVVLSTSLIALEHATHHTEPLRRVDFRIIGLDSLRDPGREVVPVFAPFLHLQTAQSKQTDARLLRTPFRTLLSASIGVDRLLRRRTRGQKVAQRQPPLCELLSTWKEAPEPTGATRCA